MEVQDAHIVPMMTVEMAFYLITVLFLLAWNVTTPKIISWLEFFALFALLVIVSIVKT